MKTTVTFKPDARKWMATTRGVLEWFVSCRDTLDDVRSFRIQGDLVALDKEKAVEFRKALLRADVTEYADELLIEMAIANTLMDAINARVASLLARKDI